jgi:glycosyl transferase family 25
MQAFLINLSRRPDRLQAMTRQLKRLGIPATRVRAVDARTAADAVVDRRFAANGPLGEIAKGDKCCTLSHLRAWEAFLQSGERYAIILEDDVVLDRRAAQLLKREDWIPEGVGLLKLEQYVSAGKRILIGTPIAVTKELRIAPLRSKHTGAAAYIIARETAQLLLHQVGKWTLPVDHMLFNPNNSPIIAKLKPYQMVPAIARQSETIGGATDIEEWRKGLRRVRPRTLRRELLHAYYEIRLLPWQILSVLRRNSHVVRFGANDNFAPASDLRIGEKLAEA